MPVPALALLRRVALADRVALGYTKPVLHKMAYGTDVDESLGHLARRTEGRSRAKSNNSAPASRISKRNSQEGKA